MDLEGVDCLKERAAGALMRLDENIFRKEEDGGKRMDEDLQSSPISIAPSRTNHLPRFQSSSLFSSLFLNFSQSLRSQKPCSKPFQIPQEPASWIGSA